MGEVVSASHDIEELLNQPDHQLSVREDTSSNDTRQGREQPMSEEDRVRLYRAALNGDWVDAREIHENHPNCFMEKISRNGDTALHIAAAAGCHSFVKQLLEHCHLTAEQLELCSNNGNTAFCMAAASGVIEIVVEMEDINLNLPNIQGSARMPPVLMAALRGHEAMVNHFLEKPDWFDTLPKPQDKIDLLISAINNNMYHVASKILDMDEELALARNGNDETPLHVLARRTQRKGASRLNSWWKFYNTVTNYPWGEHEEDDAKLKLVERLWRIVISKGWDVISNTVSRPQPKMLFVATELGNYEFVSTLIRYYPDLIWEQDEENRTIFHVAVQCRQEKIFSYFQEIKGISHLLAAHNTRTDGNNILHLAASLPSSDRLNVVSGAALQMQRELLWFQAVEDIVDPNFAVLKNNPQNSRSILPKETPRELFNREHELLRKAGEKWMRGTATSCMIVGTLVTGVIIQALLQSLSYRHKIFYSVFCVSNALSGAASIASSLTFLTIMTSRYAVEDFRKSLPLKLIIGLVLLFLSIMTMLLSFTMAIAIIFPPTILTFVVGGLAMITGSCYILLNIPLLVDACRSMFLFHRRQELFRH